MSIATKEKGICNRFRTAVVRSTSGDRQVTTRKQAVERPVGYEWEKSKSKGFKLFSDQP